MSTGEKIAVDVGPAKIDIAYERVGDPDAPAVLLIQGLGHNLPTGLWSEVAEHIADIVRMGEARIRD